MDGFNKITSIVRIFCIPRQRDPGKVTQEFISLLKENRN